MVKLNIFSILFLPLKVVFVFLEKKFIENCGKKTIFINLDNTIHNIVRSECSSDTPTIIQYKNDSFEKNFKDELPKYEEEYDLDYEMTYDDDEYDDEMEFDFLD